ncbi:MAG: NADH:flavin oxidoreductase/NADH oxidase [Candidatus Omnitrophica bacterium]|nr:NADH:flavin oxidoreductase/NADH oxidase [Candidatus Omnitrophota bacterium]
MLFTPLKVRDVVFRNRIVVSPMCQYSSEGGFLTDWHMVHLGTRAVGGAGAVIAEATAVEERGRISPNDLGIWSDEHVVALERMTAFIDSQGAVPGIQLSHAGRKASTARPWDGGVPLDERHGGWRPVMAPSSIAFDKSYPLPKELTLQDIDDLIEAFADAAERARQAGFRLLELHAAQGYLLHEFLSSVTNRRTDRYGGDFENRIRIVLEVTEAIRIRWPQRLPLFVRISTVDWIENGGWSIEESEELARQLKSRGVDLIVCSSGGLLPNLRIPTMRAGYQVSFAEYVRHHSGILTCAIGGITSAEQAETILESGQADMVAIGRELLNDPYWPIHAAGALREKIDLPVQYAREID